ncbi:hypothetical protein ACN42_g4617 [Penicillium freii]|uniref:Uncharacterized protein n=1 Tax=Penicillium freii TaxID=48697 RepID=A0A124GRW2_PENFR|nr:hypothetical protein ACN42_g4617 [Penicillium freii]
MAAGEKKKEGRLGDSNLILNINSLEVTHPTTNSPARGLYTVNSSMGIAGVRNGRGPLYGRASGGDKGEYEADWVRVGFQSGEKP